MGKSSLLPAREPCRNLTPAPRAHLQRTPTIKVAPAGAGTLLAAVFQLCRAVSGGKGPDLRHTQGFGHGAWGGQGPAWLPSTSGAVRSRAVNGSGRKCRRGFWQSSSWLLAKRGQDRGGRPAPVLANESRQRCRDGRASRGARAAAGTDGAGSAVGEAASAF